MYANIIMDVFLFAMQFNIYTYIYPHRSLLTSFRSGNRNTSAGDPESEVDKLLSELNEAIADHESAKSEAVEAGKKKNGYFRGFEMKYKMKSDSGPVLSRYSLLKN